MEESASANCNVNSTLLEPHFLAINLTWCSVSFLSFVMCIVATSLSVYRFCWKRKTVSTERTEKLLIYLVIFSMAYSFVNCFQWVRLLVQSGKPETNVGCAVVGFGITYVGDGILVIALCIGIHLLLLVCRPKCLNSVTEEERQKRYKKLELGYIISAIIAPVPFVLWPWIDNRYGPAGQWCWIKTRDENCSQLTDGFIQQILLGYLWVFVVMAFSTVATATTLGLLCYYRKKSVVLWQKDNYIYIKIRALLFYLVVTLVVNVIAVANRSIQWENRESPYQLVFVHAIAYPFWGSLSAIAMYLVVYYNWKRVDQHRKSKTLLQQTKEVVTKRTYDSCNEETNFETKYHEIPRESFVDNCILGNVPDKSSIAACSCVNCKQHS